MPADRHSKDIRRKDDFFLLSVIISIGLDNIVLTVIRNC